MHEVLLERAAERDLKALSRTVYDRVVSHLKALSHNPRPAGCKKITGSCSDWRIRIGDYRVIYEIDDRAKVVKVMRIRHRLLTCPLMAASRGPSRNPANQVKFLVDANFPPRLCVWLRSQRHEAEHFFDRNLLTATDTEIWERGRLESLVIFSRDTDFYDRALLYGAPPQIVHVAVGNCSNARLFSVLTSEWDDIEQALVSGCRLISITLEKMEVFA